MPLARKHEESLERHLGHERGWSDVSTLKLLPLAIRLLSRYLHRKAMPEWDVQEAASGETALRLVDKQRYDLIFLDQYMASVEKQLLGTETARALRSKGVKSKICGLSANDIEKSFLDSGADTFMMKPLPCRKEALTRELLHILYGEKEVS